MRYDIVLAGVGGQGILTIARAISAAAMNRGLNVKQAEVHGMSQRGGSVYSHVRISDSEIFSDLVPAGQADLIVSIEPLEALRYAQMLRPGGAVATGTSPVANVCDYPPVADVLQRVEHAAMHVAIDLDVLARAAGSTLASNTVALGAASHFLPFDSHELEESVAVLFAEKSPRIVEANRRAFRFGRSAAGAYLAAMRRGIDPSSVRTWLEGLSTEDLLAEDLDAPAEFESPDAGVLASSEAAAFESVLREAYDEDRRQLYEHEVYALLELLGAISPPRHRFIPKGSTVDANDLALFPGDRVVLKLVSQDVTHKSDVGAVRFVQNDLARIRQEIDGMVARHSREARVAGTLLVEYVEHDQRGLGGELFVGIRASREFGPIIAAGLGGTHTEFLAAQFAPGRAVAKALASETDADAFLEEFRRTVAYEILSGAVRGNERVVSDAELLRCFRAFISIARRFCVDRGDAGPDIGELEVNPFAFRAQRLLPLDGRGRLRPAAKEGPARSSASVRALLEPKTAAIVGVSAKAEGLGRVVLQKMVAAGFDKSALTIVKEGAKEIEGVRCVPNLQALTTPVDVLVVATPADASVGIVAEVGKTHCAKSCILISGGAGETPQSEQLGAELREAIRAARGEEEGTAFLGPNCMGVRSLPARLDTFFVPDDKLPNPVGRPTSPIAILSQSGALAVSRLSALEALNPAFVVSFGNQYDVTLGDLLELLIDREDVRVAGVYMEGFADLDGLRAVRSVREWTRRNKTVVLYKGGRNEMGRSAAAGHTAAVAGDYDVCRSAFESAGALVATSLAEFNGFLELSAAYEAPRGRRMFCVTNAGMEAVAVGDCLGDERDAELATLEGPLGEVISQALVEQCLSQIVALRNPLDLTPMAGEAAYDRMVTAALDSPDADAVLVSCVPLAPSLRTLESDLARPDAFPSIAARWKASGKPICFVIDAGAIYDPLARAIRSEGIPVFRSADDAARTFARWLARAG